MSEDEPKIVAFLCNWCSPVTGVYAGADMAGVSRFQYPTNIRPIRVMCSARVTPHIVLQLFKEGVDGVVVTGCHPDDCHNFNEDLYAEKWMKVTRQLMEMVGLHLKRLKLEWISASGGERLAEVIDDFVEQLNELGPSPINENNELQLRLDAAIEAARPTSRISGHGIGSCGQCY